jgi:hypothetical protein
VAGLGGWAAGLLGGFWCGDDDHAALVTAANQLMQASAMRAVQRPLLKSFPTAPTRAHRPMRSKKIMLKVSVLAGLDRSLSACGARSHGQTADRRSKGPTAVSGDQASDLR